MYIDMLKKFFMPVLKEECPVDVLFKQDGVPSHFHMKVANFLNGMFPEKWFGRGSLSFGHIVQLALVPFIFSFGSISFYSSDDYLNCNFD